MSRLSKRSSLPDRKGAWYDFSRSSIRMRGSSLGRQPVFLLAAAGLVRLGHLYETCIERGAQINQSEAQTAVLDHSPVTSFALCLFFHAALPIKHPYIADRLPLIHRLSGRALCDKTPRFPADSLERLCERRDKILHPLGHVRIGPALVIIVVRVNGQGMVITPQITGVILLQGEKTQP